jgi:thiol-disulfide isomerase/thioredoxin
MMRKPALLFLPAAAALFLLACAPKQAPAAASKNGAESASVPAAPDSSAAEEVSLSAAPGSTNEMLLKAGFAVPKAEIAASDFTLESLDGRRVSLASYKGSLVFLSFWATWCGPCKQELPSAQALYDKLKKKGFVIVAVDVMEENKTVSAFVKANRMTFPVLLDADGRVGGEYDARSIPTNYLVDRKGKILARIVGYDGTPWDSPERVALFEKLLAM